MTPKDYLYGLAGALLMAGMSLFVVVAITVKGAFDLVGWLFTIPRAKR